MVSVCLIWKVHCWSFFREWMFERTKKSPWKLLENVPQKSLKSPWKRYVMICGNHGPLSSGRKRENLQCYVKSILLDFTLTFLPAGWISRNIVNFLVFYHLIKGMCPKICGNWVLLIYLKIPTSLLEDYSLDFVILLLFVWGLSLSRVALTSVNPSTIRIYFYSLCRIYVCKIIFIC